MFASNSRDPQPSRPYSPSSPPLGSYKQSSSAVTHPQTPNSPSLMSVSSQRYASPPLTAYASSAQATSQLNSSATPPSTAPMSAQNSQQPILTTTNTFPTPSSIVMGHGSGTGPSHKTDDRDGDTPMDTDDDHPETKPSVGVEAADTMEIDAGVLHRTDHDRHAETAIALNSTVSGAGDQKVGLERKSGSRGTSRGRPDLSRLHADVGRPYLLLNTPHPMANPHPTQDLLSLYALHPLAATVARIDPVTGEKRKTRKTYKRYLQMFDLSGKNSEVNHPPDEPGGFQDMLAWPDEEWDNQKVIGKDVKDGLSEDSLLKLERALTCAPGPLPEFDASLIGLDSAPAAKETRRISEPPTVAAQPRKPIAQSNGSTLAEDVANGDPPRPKRNAKKRRYDEKSFEGYGEGFADDDVDTTAIRSDGEKDDGRRGSGSGKKKRKKNSDAFSNAGSPGLVDRGGSYGVGMVGVGTGIGAYGR